MAKTPDYRSQAVYAKVVTNLHAISAFRGKAAGIRYLDGQSQPRELLHACQALYFVDRSDLYLWKESTKMGKTHYLEDPLLR